LVILFGQSKSHGALIFTHVARADKGNAIRDSAGLLSARFFAWIAVCPLMMR
jgi:hypothetical protein